MVNRSIPCLHCALAERLAEACAAALAQRLAQACAPTLAQRLAQACAAALAQRLAQVRAAALAQRLAQVRAFRCNLISNVGVSRRGRDNSFFRSRHIVDQ